MTTPLITVLTAVHDGSRYLGQAIASIREQTFTDLEHIIVDDASQDDSADIVEQAARADDRVRLVRRSQRGGPYVAANEGLKVARGKYVARIDADDLATPERLETQLGFLSARPGLRACGGFHRMITDSGVASRESRFTTAPGVLRWRLTAAGGPTHSTAFVEKAAFDELGGYAPQPMSQDLRMWCELSQRDWLGIVPQVVAYRRRHDESIGRRASQEQFRLALEASQDHLKAISGECWTLDDVRALWDVARAEPSAYGRGFRVLDRWSALWRADEKLSKVERRELDRWTNRRRYLLAAVCLDDHPISSRTRMVWTKLHDMRRRIEASLDR